MFNIHQTILDEYGGLDEERVEAYGVGLMGEYEASPEAKVVVEAGGDAGWPSMMFHYAVDYLGVTPADMSVADLREVLFELFPSKVSTPPEAAPEIITSLRAFWSFVERQYGLASAKQILAELGDDAVVRLKKELADPRNWGMAKSFFMLGQKAGFDMTTQEGVDDFMQVYNFSWAAGFFPPGDDGGWALAPARPKRSSAHDSRRKARKKQRQARKRSRK